MDQVPPPRVAVPLGTPLSDLIAACTTRMSPEAWGQFLDAFQSSEVGVHAIGMPVGAAGVAVSTDDRPLSVGLSRHAGRGPFVLAYADPPAFAQRFGRPFNAGMTGAAVLATALTNPDCVGVLVNSALVEVSIVIDRTTAESLMRADQQPASK